MEKLYAIFLILWFLGFLLGFPYFLWSICSERPDEEPKPRIHET